MLDILYQDPDIIVAVKPVGAESEDGKQGKTMPTLLRESLNLPADAPIYTLHRLDKGVSGVMVYAKTKHAAAQLSKQIQEHVFQKEYLAVAEGFLSAPVPESAQPVINLNQQETSPNRPVQNETATAAQNTLCGRWEDLLYHDKRKNKVFTVKKERKGVKKAALRYTVLGQATLPSEMNALTVNKSDAAPMSKKNDTAVTVQPTPCTLLQIALETGRTHQIRVQCASRKLPLVGDARYGSKTKGCNIALFSHKLSFYHPTTHAWVSFTKEAPVGLPWDLFV